MKYARALLKNVELYEEDDEGGSSSCVRIPSDLAPTECLSFYRDFGPVKEQLEAMYLKMQEITDVSTLSVLY